jgi:hypothetical protein
VIVKIKGHPYELKPFGTATLGDVVALLDQAGLTLPQLYAAFERLMTNPTAMYDDLESIRALGASLWLASRRQGQGMSFQEFINSFAYPDDCEWIAEPSGGESEPDPTQAAREDSGDA